MDNNRNLLPIKLHYFLFMGALGPALPFISVIGKQLGVSEITMGMIMMFLPVLYFISKPLLGYLFDSLSEYRKYTFTSCIGTMGILFLLIILLPTLKTNFCIKTENCNQMIDINYLNNSDETIDCALQCNNQSISNDCEEICEKIEYVRKCNTCDQETDSTNNIFYMCVFVVLISLGCTFFNACNSVSDTLCFNMIGDKPQLYGKQRVWGSLSYGLAAFISTFPIELLTNNKTLKNNEHILPFFIIAIFITMDVIVSSRLKDPTFDHSTNILKDVCKVFRHRQVAIFMLFVIAIGVFEGFSIYYTFWYLEEIASKVNLTHEIRFIEGVLVLIQSSMEIIIFPITGKLLKIFGYGYSLSLCLLLYAIKFTTFSFVENPWISIVIEIIQGIVYAVTYTTVTSYANAITPKNVAATTLGVVGGVYDGLGYALGGLTGGVWYKVIGGQNTFFYFGILAFILSMLHTCIYLCFMEKCNSSTRLRHTDGAEIECIQLNL